MTVAIKNNNKAPLVVPPAIRRRARFKTGDELEFKASGGVITILLKLPSADDEYTPEQRRIIDARLAKGLADIKAGRTRGPFDSVDEMIADMKAQVKKRASAKRAKRSR
jgi:bifunctional DNA-binding transcriptional regulator/antitoxin component of YhaV-PrlF toxin-antitoxin module